MIPHEKLRKAAQHFLDLAQLSTDKDERKRLLEKSLRLAQAAEDVQLGSNDNASRRTERSDDQKEAPPVEGRAETCRQGRY